MFNLIFHDPPSEGWVEYGPVGRTQFTRPEGLPKEWPTDKDLYFGPALRRDSNHGGTKDNVLASRTLWADIDREEPFESTLPPSVLVWTGHGWHAYWLLNSWIGDLDLIENANRSLAVDVGADYCWNANRLLRVPGTFNHKSKPPVECKLVVVRACIYTVEECLAPITSKTRRKIRTGDSRGYRSRSERDWAVLKELVSLGFGDVAIENVFKYNRIGDKYREDPKYLTRSLGKVRESASSYIDIDFDPRDDGYYIQKGNDIVRVSTFTLAPKTLLEGDSGDSLVVDIHSGDNVWKGVVFSRSAFNSRSSFDKEAPNAAWQWLGKDDDVRRLLPYLLKQIVQPRSKSTGTLGLHRTNLGWSYIGEGSSIGGGNLVYVPTRREHPNVSFANEDLDSDAKRYIGECLVGLNLPECIWPVIGWFTSALVKPTLGLQFPSLSVWGTKGSGKSTTVRIMQQVLGLQADPISYDCNTTRFSILSLLSSSNCFPISFTEFDQASSWRFLRFVLLSYDSGHDVRGRADQTTQSYTLSAPFSIDGQDRIQDPAARERIISVKFSPDTISDKGGQPCQSLKSMKSLEEYYSAFGTGLLRYYLSSMESGSLQLSLLEARQSIPAVFKLSIPERVMRNLSLCWFGITVFCSYTNVKIPDMSEVIGSALADVHSTIRGRPELLADVFVEEVLAAIENNVPGLRATSSIGVVWFHLGTAYTWWVGQRIRTKQVYLGKDAIKSQLSECSYHIKPTNIEGWWMDGIDLNKAVSLGLDIPYNKPKEERGR